MNINNRSKLRKDILYHFKMIARLYKNGVPLTDALVVFCDDGVFDWKRIIISKLQFGKTFGQSIEECNLPLRGYELTIIKKSEMGGNLAVGLNRVYEMNQGIEKAKNKLILALMYPCVILTVSVILILIILLMIVPKIKPLFSSNIKIPWSTKVLFFTSDHIAGSIALLIVLVFVGMVAVYLFVKKNGWQEFQNRVLSFIIKIPVIGNLIKHYSAYISFRIASEVFASSGLLVESLKDSAGGSIIPSERNKLLNIAEDVEGGVPLSKSMSRVVSTENKIWLPLVVCGEETGTISETFSSISEIHQELFNESVAVINKLIEPVSMILVGIGVGFIALSIITPIYSLISYTGY